MSVQSVHAILLLLFVVVVEMCACVSMEKDGLSSHSSASIWFERASVLKHTTTHQFVDDDDDDDENVSTVKTTLFCRSHSQWL